MANITLRLCSDAQYSLTSMCGPITVPEQIGRHRFSQCNTLANVRVVRRVNRKRQHILVRFEGPDVDTSVST